MKYLHTGFADRIYGSITSLPSTTEGLTYATLGQVNFGSGRLFKLDQ